MRRPTGWRISVLGFALACAVLAGVGWINYGALADLRDAGRRVDHTLLVETAAADVLSLLTGAEAAQRGFLITGGASYVEPYELAVASLPQRLEQLRRLTVDLPRQQERVTELDGLIQERLSRLEAGIAARRTQGFEPAARIVQTEEGKQLMDRIRAVIAGLRAEEERTLSERTAQQERAARVAVTTTVTGVALALILIAAATTLMARAVHERSQEHAARTAAEAVRAAVAASEEWLRVTLASIGDAVIATDDEGRVTLINAVACALTGWAEADAAGRPLDEVFVIINEESRRPAENPVHRVLREGVTTGLANHTILVSKERREIPIDDSAAPIKAADGGLVGAVIVFRDITTRRQAERERAALFEQERKARTEAERVARMLRQLQVVTEPALSPVSADTFMRELLTRVRTVLASDTATILLLTEDGAHLRPVSSDGLRELVAEDVRIPLGRGVAGRIAVSEAGLIFPDLREVEVQSPFLRDRVKSLVGAPLRVGERLIGVVHVGSSTPRQYAEDDLRLLRLVAERVALALERARLHEAEREARREAEVANQAKDEFLATLSHELRQPLNAILGWTQTARAPKRDEATLIRAFDVIERNVKLQERLINDLLDVSRIITGKLRLEVQPMDLRAVVEAAIDVVRPGANAKGISLETALDPSAGLVSGDPNRLQQVVWNLLSNAIRFTPRGGRVEVRLQRVDSQAELVVSDTGEGITAEFLPHVFDRFRQAGQAPLERREGLGLGLAIVRHLVELHGGTVRADSPGQGQGATFTVRLPLLAVRVSGDGVEEPRLALEHDRSSGAPPVLAGVRALVVDDEADAGELVRMVLEESGAVVTVARSAAEALKVLERDRLEVLISDIAMPGQDGYALIRQVRALPAERGGRIPAVALTAHARTDDRTRALLAGFHLHVPRPVEAAELIAVVASLLGRRSWGI